MIELITISKAGENWYLNKVIVNSQHIAMVIESNEHNNLLREGKIPPDKRVPFSPIQCRDIVKKYPIISIYMQPSSIRCFPDEEYQTY